MAKNNSTVDRIQAVWNKHGGEEGIDLLLAGKTIIVPAPKQFPIWKTVNLGLASSVRQYHRKIKDGFQFSFYEYTKVEEFRLCGPAEIDLVKIKARDLGLELPAKYPEICAAARKLGLELCPRETGFALRLQYNDQPVGERLTVASELIRESNSWRLVGVNNGVHSEWPRPQFWISSTGYTKRLDKEFVFMLPRK